MTTRFTINKWFQIIFCFFGYFWLFIDMNPLRWNVWLFPTNCEGERTSFFFGPLVLKW